MSPPLALSPNLTGAVAGALCAFFIWLLPDCSAPEQDPHEDLFVAPLDKYEADPAVIFPADRSFFWVGEKREIETAPAMEPNS